MYLNYNCERRKYYISEILTTSAFWEGLYDHGEIIVKIPDPNSWYRKNNFHKAMIMSPWLFQVSHKNKNMLFILLLSSSTSSSFTFSAPVYGYICIFYCYIFYGRLYGRVLSLEFPVELHKRKMADLASVANLSFLSTSEGVPRKYNYALRLWIYYMGYDYRRELTTHGNFLEDCVP